jgi:hypothetical protein
MFDWTKTTIQDVIETVKKARNYSRPWTINEDGSINKDALVIDILPILEALKEYEDLDIDTGLTDRLFTEDYIKGDNTYNWSSPLSNNLEMRWGKIDDEDYVLIAVHLYGDVRCNYTDYFALKMDIDDLIQLDVWMDYKDVGDRYVADLNAWSDSYNVYDTIAKEDVGEFYESEVNDLLEAIKEKE